MWEETAAKHVSLAAQLGQVSALAARWRKLELASWHGLLARTVERFAAGADKVGGRAGCSQGRGGQGSSQGGSPAACLHKDEGEAGQRI